MHFHNIYAANKNWLVEFLDFKLLTNAVKMENQGKGVRCELIA